MNINIICTYCEGDPVMGDGSMCPVCDGECVLRLDEQDVEPAHDIIEDCDRRYMEQKWGARSR